MRFARTLAGIALAGLLAGSCAYYNTFYLARKNYYKGTEGKPYVLQRSQPARSADFNRSIEYAKKVIAQYPKSKWVDDAYLLWAKALLGNEDPRETVRMLEEFDALYPASPVSHEARFVLGVAYRLTRKYPRALAQIDTFLMRAPKDNLAPYAHLERARTLVEMDRPAEAAAEAGIVIDRYGKSEVVTAARFARAEAFFAAKDFDRARSDYRQIGLLAATDAERFDLLLHEADCLEAARNFDGELGLLQDALSHEKEPTAPDTTGGRGLVQTNLPPGADRWGRLQLRIGGVHVLTGRLDESVASFRRVAEDYPRTPLAAEALYRLGNAYERLGEDFDRARAEYARVREHGAQSAFSTQASQRLTQLERMIAVGESGSDSLARKAEAGFLLAEQYLLELDKPERALEEYRRIARDLDGTPHAAKALTAEAWVLRRLDQKAAADSLWWKVVREYPATESQIAARDYLESDGIHVPPELIKLPEKPVVVPAIPDSVALTPVPEGIPSEEEALRARSRQIFGGGPPATGTPAPADTAARPRLIATPADTLHRTLPTDSTGAVRDSSGFHAPPPDTLGGTAPVPGGEE